MYIITGNSSSIVVNSQLLFSYINANYVKFIHFIKQIIYYIDLSLSLGFVDLSTLFNSAIPLQYY